MNRLLTLVVLLLLGCARGDGERKADREGTDTAAPGAVAPSDAGAASDSSPPTEPREPTPGGIRDTAPSTPDAAAPAPDGPAGSQSAAPDSGSGPADSADPYAVLDRASAAYESLRSVKADFVQQARNPILRRTVRSSGTLYQRQPDLFLMRFDDPAGDVIVSDGEYLWIYYPSVDSAQVIRLPASRGAGATDLRSQFIGRPRERFRAASRGTGEVGGRPADVLLLEPRGEEGYRTLEVWIDREDGLARRFEITEPNGLVRRFELSSLRKNPDLAPGLFRFEPPAGARVVDRG